MMWSYFRLALLLVAVQATALPATADGLFSGTWQFNDSNTNQTLLELNLFDTGAALGGAGTLQWDGHIVMVDVLHGQSSSAGAHLVFKADDSEETGALIWHDVAYQDNRATLIFDATKLSLSGHLVDQAKTTSHCAALEETLSRIADQQRAAGAREDGAYIGIILNQFGLPGGGIAGTYTQDRCHAAQLALRTAFLSDIDASDVRQVPLEYVSSVGWAPGNGGDSIALWSLDGSDFVVETAADGAIQIWYWRPSDIATQTSVEQGVLFFEGNRVGDELGGQARVFSANCEPYVYRVRGTIDSGGGQMMLVGHRPTVATDCAVANISPHVLRLDFLADQPTDVEPADTPGIGVWGTAWQGNATIPISVYAGPGPGFAQTATLANNTKDILITGEGCRPLPDSTSFEALSTDQKTFSISQSWCHITVGQIGGWVAGGLLRHQ